MTDYIRERKALQEYNSIKDMSAFGIFGGLFLLVFFGIKWLRELSTISTVWGGLAILGGGLMIIGFFVPQVLSPIYKTFSFLGNRVGEFIFMLLLSVIFVVFIIPASIIWRNKRVDYGYNSWNKKCESSKGFSPYVSDTLQIHSGITDTILKVFGGVIRNGKAIFLPVIVIMILLGLVLFFVSSTVIAPFIYTLF